MIGIGMLGAGFIGQMHSLDLRLASAVRRQQPQVEAGSIMLADTNLELAEEVQQRYGWETSQPTGTLPSTIPMIQYLHQFWAQRRPCRTEHRRRAASASISFRRSRWRAPPTRHFRMWQAAEQAGVKHMCAFIHRFIPALQLARKMIADGRSAASAISAATSSSTCSTRTAACHGATAQALAGGGATGDLGSHHIDQARFLVGEVRRVNAMARSWSKDTKGVVIDVNDDWFVAGAELDNGVTAVFEASRVTEGHPLTGRIEVDGTLGTLRWEMERVSELHLTEPRKGRASSRRSRRIIPTATSGCRSASRDRSRSAGATASIIRPATCSPPCRRRRSDRSAQRSRTATGSPRSSTRFSARPRRGGPRTWFTARRRGTARKLKKGHPCIRRDERRSAHRAGNRPSDGPRRSTEPPLRSAPYRARHPRRSAAVKYPTDKDATDCGP